MPILSQKLLLTVALVGTSALTKSLLEVGYEKSTGRKPPKNPAGRGVSWKTALLWSGIAGFLTGAARTTVRRVATTANDGEPIDEDHRG